MLTAVLPAALVTAFFLLRPMAHPPVAAQPAAPTVPEKSIAVLPFENLSDDKANGFFTDGVQDEILTDLSKVADLKVISRTSVMQYRDHAARNLRDIATQLGRGPTSSRAACSVRAMRSASTPSSSTPAPTPTNGP